MSKIIITSDSTCDLSPELVEANDIRILPLSVMLGAKSHRDGIDIVPADIFRFFDETGQLPKTAAPSVSEYETFFAPFVEQGNYVVHFNISSKASGSHGFALAAAKSFPGKCRSKIFSRKGVCGRFAGSLHGAGTSGHEGMRPSRGRQERTGDL